MERAHQKQQDFERKLAVLQERVERLYQQARGDAGHRAEKQPVNAAAVPPTCEGQHDPHPTPWPQLDIDHHGLEHLVQNMPAGLALLDTNYHLVLTNVTARRYFAVLTTATLGERVTALGTQPIEQLLTRRTDGLPHEVVGAGSPRPVFAIQPQPLPASTPRGGWVLLLQDVTAERTVQQQRAQQERLVALEQLVMGLAHQFNSLLCGIIGYAELLQTQVAGPKAARDELATIARWGRRGVQWVHQMLDFSGQSLTRRRPRDLLPILQTLTPLLARSLPASIRVVFDSAPDMYQINTDVPLILQLLANLTVNARDAMPDGGELRFCLSRLTLRPADPRPYPGMRHGEWVTLTVTDTGTGIPPQVQGRIFEPFFTTAAADHAGLGLAQVYGIVKQHGGYMTVDSAPGRGAAFTIYFPSQVAPADTGAADATPEELSRGQDETLLLVDNDPITREALRLTLQYLHYRVLTATNGPDALALYAYYGDAIALVLTALSPHESDGLGWLKPLWQQAAGLKVIVMARELRQADRHDLLAQGVIACLPKPPNLPMLAQAVRRALEP